MSFFEVKVINYTQSFHLQLLLSYWKYHCAARGKEEKEQSGGLAGKVPRPQESKSEWSIFVSVTVGLTLEYDLTGSLLAILQTPRTQTREIYPPYHRIASCLISEQVR